MAQAAASVDVLVIGAGPGGSTAAYFLARHGVDVALVEKASFPREKVCGDGLTPRVVKLLGEMGVDTDDPGFVHVEGLRIYGRDASLTLPWPVLADWPGLGQGCGLHNVNSKTSTTSSRSSRRRRARSSGNERRPRDRSSRMAG